MVVMNKSKEWTQTDVNNLCKLILADWSSMRNKMSIVRNSGISCSMLAQMTGFSERAVSDLIGTIEKSHKQSKLFRYFILMSTVNNIYKHLHPQTIKKAQRRIERKRQRTINKPNRVIVRPETDKHISYD